MNGFGLRYRDGQFEKVMNMDEVIQTVGLGSSGIPNTDCITEARIYAAGSLLKNVVELLEEEVDKLIGLQEKHKEYYQHTLFEQERRLKEQERRVDELFDQFMKWVTETLTIQNNPYIRIVAVLMGVSQ